MTGEIENFEELWEGFLFWFFILLIIALGIWMICDPNATQEVEVRGGRRGLFRLVFAWLWSRTFGVILVILALCAVGGHLSSDDKSKG